MPERRGSRFAAEALFLAALAVALALARLDAIEIAGAMLVGWLVVAALEWAVSRGESHYGSGLPPRFHVPIVTLPPPKPLEQVGQGYPNASRDDAPTWIASPALRAEVLGTWPLAPLDATDGDEEPEPVFVSPSEASDPWTAVALPPTPDDRARGPAERSVPLIRRDASSSGAPDSWYTLDPIGEPAPRRFRRSGGAGDRGIRVPSRPVVRPLPNHRNG